MIIKARAPIILRSQVMPSLLSSEFTRTGITAVDADASILTRNLTAAANTILTGAVCDTGGCSLGVSLYLLGSLGQILKVIPMVFTSRLVADWGGAFSAECTNSLWGIQQAREVVVKVDSISSGTWTLNAAMC
jgi:hypothetical protein